MKKTDLILQHFIDTIKDCEVKDWYINLYGEYPENFKRVFSYFHQELNTLFNFLNTKNRGNKHFNADESRQLLFLIDSIEDLNRNLSVHGEEIVITNKYEEILLESKKFLESYGGSPIPEDFEKINIINYEQVFSTNSKKIIITPTNQNIDLQLIGEGAFSKVSRYKDCTYNKFFVVKTLKKNSTERELERFKKEYEILSGLNFPYILEVYSFDEEKISYTMEHCDNTLMKYIKSNNTKLSFNVRKRIALQFLYAMNYLHLKKILHRDISYNNVLVKQFDNAVMIKLSDFGLMKIESSDFTKIDTEIKGTIIDPSLSSFKDYAVINEIYAIGFVLQFIFTGKQSFEANKSNLSKIIHNCTNSNLEKRYQCVGDIINEIELFSE